MPSSETLRILHVLSLAAVVLLAGSILSHFPLGPARGLSRDPLYRRTGAGRRPPLFTPPTPEGGSRPTPTR
jgi:hypothetical protein